MSGKHRKCNPLEEAIITAMQTKTVATPKVEDPDEMFLLSLLPTIRRLSDRQKSAAKIKIQQLLHDIEFPPNQPTCNATFPALHTIPARTEMHDRMPYLPAAVSRPPESPQFRPFTSHPADFPRQMPTSLTPSPPNNSEMSYEELKQPLLSGQGATGVSFLQQLM